MTRPPLDPNRTRIYAVTGEELFPVFVPNAQQNTPSIDDLNAVLAAEEAARHTDKSVEEQLEELIAAIEAEKHLRSR